MKTGVKITLWTVGAVAALVVAATLAAGPVAKRYVNSHGEELVGRRLHVEGLKLNVYRGHLALHGLTLYEDNGEDLFASFDTLDARIRLLPLIGHTVHLKHITLSGLNSNIIHSADRYNFQSLIDHFASDESKTDTTPSDWVVKLYNIRISHAQLHYRDGGQRWHLPDINLRVPGFVIGGEEESEGGLNIAFTHGGRLNINANHDGHSGDYTLRAALNGFALENIEPLLANTLREATLGGALNADLTARGNVQRIMQSAIDGSVSLHELQLQSGGKSVASLDRLLVDIDAINLETNTYRLRRVTLDGLAAHYEQFADGNTVSRLIAPATNDTQAEADTMEADDHNTPQDTSATAARPPLKLTIGEVSVSNCNLTYSDHTLPDPFRFPLTNLSVEATDITTGGDNNARLRATLPGGGSLTAHWNGNIDHWKQRQRLFLSIKGLDMTQLSPWTVYYTGQPIEDGVFGLTTRLNIDNSNLDNQNKLDIYKATVGSRRPDVVPQQKIPLKTALYILKDKDDKILIDLPVKGNIDSPEFNYMKLVWKTLGQLLVKVATSPARALAGALGMKSDDLDFLEISPSQRSLTSEQYHVLADLATIAKSDPHLALTLHLQMPESESKHVERLNQTVREYLTEQGLSEKQFNITTGQPTGEEPRTGYAITSEMQID